MLKEQIFNNQTTAHFTYIMCRAPFLIQTIMSYYVTTQWRDNVTLFLADRNKTKKHWWTMSLTNAMAFYNESAAEYSAKRLRYKSPCVVDSKEAKRLEGENDFTCAMLEEHPFSSDALGQD